MRSSIACARCRRSKVKCLNNGVNTPCRACVNAGRDCVYPSPASGDRSHRRDPSLGRPSEHALMPSDTPRSVRSKPKKVASQYFGLQSNRALVDALDPTVLTPQVWLDLSEIWQRHYAIDLPFIHPPSFVKLLSQAHGATAAPDFATPKSGGPNELPAAPAEFLLAFLALTSRFHPGLVSHHSPGSASRPSNPLFASEYYAAACKGKLSQLADLFAVGNDQGRNYPNLYRVQAYLMLAFHEWGNCEGMKAYELLGQAIRYSHLIGLNYQEDVEASPLKNIIVRPLQPEALLSAQLSSEDASRDQEVRRRTFWSCFILDRCLSSGRFMPSSIHVQDIKIQLPSSERAFLFNERVRTPLLSDFMDESSGLERNRSAASTPAPLMSPRTRAAGDELTWESGSMEGLVSRYVKAAEAYNAVVQWACRGGRLNEKYPPWETQSTWHALYKQVNNLIEKLPRDLQLSQANIQAHITSRTSASFTLLHTLLLLSKIILHREFLPFLPIRYTFPKGPGDSLSPFLTSAPGPETTYGFWGESAAEIFKSSRELLNLYLTCMEWKVLVETPLVGFASYMIAVMGVYSCHFPWMDPKEYMSQNPNSSHGQAGFLGLFAARDADRARKACDLVAVFRPKLRMADGWFKTLGRLHRYFFRTKKELQKNYTFNPFGANAGPFHGRSSLLSLRMSDDQYRPLDAAFGRSPSPSLDTEMTDAPPRSVKDESRRTTEGAAREAWAAVNNMPPPMDPPSSSTQPAVSNGSPYPQATSISSGPYPALSPQSAAPYSPGITPHQNPAPAPAPASPATTATTEPAETPSQVSAASPRVSQQWTHEQVDQWLNGLESVFGANDLAAFVEAVDWRNFGAVNAPVKGWLRLVWMGASV